jgi:diaminopimelate epimerase
VKIPFKKLNGAGNDFVVVDNREANLELSPAQIARICDRRRGVGADGFILIEPATGHDFFMHFFNADGGEEQMCGNGARCSAAFVAAAAGGAGDTTLRFATGSGPITAIVTGTGARMEVEMAMMDAREMRTGIAVQVAQVTMNIHFMIVGTRHAIVPVDDTRALNANEINDLGRAIRYHPEFAPVGANVNFVSMAEDGRIHIRTYEKGVEAETHACGTGSVAAAVWYAHQGRGQSPATVVQRGGDELRIRFLLKDDGAGDVVMTGPAEVNFEGVLDLPSIP